MISGLPGINNSAKLDSVMESLQRQRIMEQAQLHQAMQAIQGIQAFKAFRTFQSWSKIPNFVFNIQSFEQPLKFFKINN